MNASIGILRGATEAIRCKEQKDLINEIESVASSRPKGSETEEIVRVEVLQRVFLGVLTRMELEITCSHDKRTKEREY